VLRERAALLTRDNERRAERQLSAAQAHVLAGTVDRADALLFEATPGLSDPRSTAQATWLKGKIRYHRGHVAGAASTLVGAARQLRMLDPPAARDALLSALEATVFAGWASSAALLQEIAQTAGELPATTASPDSAASLLLQGCITRATGEYGAAVPALRRAVQAFLADEVAPDVALRRLELVAVAAVDLLDDRAVEQLTTDWIDRARQRGALAMLADGLAFRSAFVDAPGGRLAAARAAEAEAHELAEVTGNPGLVPPTGAHTLLTLALGGREAEARATAAAVAGEAPGRVPLVSWRWRRTSSACWRSVSANTSPPSVAWVRPTPMTRTGRDPGTARPGGGRRPRGSARRGRTRAEAVGRPRHRHRHPARPRALPG
jgi:hypothetical protein